MFCDAAMSHRGLCGPTPRLVLQISPRPGFVLKTKLIDTGMKVFVNVCQHERIGESSMVKKLDKEGQEVGMHLSSPSAFTMSVCSLSIDLGNLSTPVWVVENVTDDNYVDCSLAPIAILLCCILNCSKGKCSLG